MEIRQLKYFIAVAEEGNISRAAARLHISQPPLTRHIKSLEASLGVELFVRNHAGVELTQAGALLLEHARNIKTHVELASLQARRAAAGQYGRIEIGVYGTAMLGVLPEILRRFQAGHPEVEMALQSAPKGPQLEALRQGRLTLAFDRYFPTSDDIAVELVYREPILVALHEQHPLAAEAEIRIPQLRGQVLIGETGRVHQRSAHMFQRHGFLPEYTHHAADMISSAVLAAAGFGIAFVPACVANLKLPGLACRPLAGEPAASMVLHAAWRRSDTHPLLQEMLTTLREFRREQGLDEAPAP